jgi:hypothetical protein
LHDRRCAIAWQPQRSRCHDDGIAFHERAAAAMKLDQFRHGHGRFRGIGRKRRLAAPAPSRHHEQQSNPDQKRDIAAVQDVQQSREQKYQIDR